MLLAAIREQKKNLKFAQDEMNDIRHELNLIYEKELRRQMLLRLINRTEYDLLMQRYQLYLLC